VILPLWNAWYFLTLYTNADGVAGSGDGGPAATTAVTPRLRTDQTGVLDRYLLAKVHDLVATMTTQMDAYDLFGACATLRSFLDTLTNWYIRRSRDRFWAGTQTGGQDSVDAFDTLHTALHVVTRVAAPLLPMVTEAIYTGLSGDRSVHLTDWPSADQFPADAALVSTMDAVRDVCSAASAVRKARGLRNRLPLAQLVVTAPGAEAMAPFASILRDEVNVKHVAFGENVNAGAKYELKLVPAALGPRLGNEMQRVMGAFRKGDYTLDPNARPVVGGIELVEGEYELRLVPTDPDASAVLPSGDGVVTLDLVVTPELEAEGLVRDVVRQVQQARRDAGLQVSDRVAVTIVGPARLVAAVRTHEAFVRDETLAVSVEVSESESPASATGELDGSPVSVVVSVVEPPPTG
jgi:isoleucyl-tRNA synthetase